MNAARPYSLSGLYIILDPSVCPARPLIDVLTTAAEAGASLFQYRNKNASMKDAYVEALALRQAAAKAGVLFIINDRCDLALAVDADGVHLGQGDLPQMHAIGIHGQGQVAAIVDDEEYACLRSSLSERQSFHVGLLHRCGLVAILEEGGACLSRDRQHLDQGTRRADRWIENDIEA